MTLPYSGTISMSQVDVELGRSSTATISLNDSAVRSLFGISSGTISLNDGHGKSNCPPYGTYLYAYCSGDNLVYRYANGSCGYYDENQGEVCGQCGYTIPYGTYLGNYCDGGALYNVYADGSCGSYSEYQSGCDCDTCGCGCPPPAAPLDCNCYVHPWVCSANGGYIESNASTSYGNITDHGYCAYGDGCSSSGSNYDGGRQNYYYTFLGCYNGLVCYYCYAYNDTGGYASSDGGCI